MSTVETEVGPSTARITVQSPSGDRVFPLRDRPITVGRAPENDVSIADPRASRVHLRIEPRPGGYRVVDTGSQNGTFRNGRRVRSAPVRPDDVIVVGNTRIIFELGNAPPEDRRPTKSGDETQEVEASEPDTVSGVSTDALGKRLQRVAEVTRALNADPSAEGLLDAIIDAAVELTGSERGFLILSRKEGMEFAAARNIDQKDLSKPEFEVSWSIAIQVGTRAQPVLAVNAAEDERFSKLESVESLGLRSVLCVPVSAPNRVMGVIYVDNRVHLGAYSPDDQAVLEILADQAGIALANRGLMKDLVNKKNEVEGLNDRLQAEVERQGTEIKRMRAALGSDGNPYEDYRALLGGSARMDELRHLLQKVSATDFPVLIQGESGTGKELVARCVHANSGRAQGAFVSINCAAIPETLLENELFGHVRGAFTGADSKKQGLFEAAHGGTLFLDEVSEMSSAMQSRLLRVLQEGEIRPVGGKEPVQVDVRVIAASNRDLASMVQSKEFREDLYYRLRVLPVTVPPLRERREDIPDLIGHFFHNHTGDRGVPAVSPEAMDVLCSYAWPGNVRELENEVKRLSVLAGPVVERASISKHILEAGEMLVGKDSDFEDLNRLVESIETREIQKALSKSRGNKTRAAELLGITRFTLQRKLDKYDIAVD